MSSEEIQSDVKSLVVAVNDAAKRVIAPWVTLLVTMTYMFVATFAVTQEALLRNAPAKLPILNVDLPLIVFFSVAPALVLLLHFYSVVHFVVLSEKLSAFERALKEAMPVKSDRYRFRNVFDVSWLTRVPSERFERWPGKIGWVYRAIVFGSMVLLPVLLLLVFQLKFLPFQDTSTTWTHRVMVALDVMLGMWLWAFIAVPNYSQSIFAIGSRILVTARVATFVVIPACVLFFSVAIASFPGEPIYDALKGSWIQERTTKSLLESRVDYVSGGVARWFSNRLVLVDHNFVSTPSLSLRGRNLRKAVLDRSDLRGIDFTASDLTEASLRGSRLQEARFRCATPSQIAQRTQFDDPKVEPEADCARLPKADFSFADLTRANFQNANLNGAMFNSATITATVFNEATIMGGSFTSSRGRLVSFAYSQLQGADFALAQLRLANFSSSSLHGARLSEAYLQAAQFDDARVQGATFASSRLQGASFSRSRLQNVRLDGALLHGASFPAASLDMASLRCSMHFRTDMANAEWASVGYSNPCKIPREWDVIGVYSPDDRGAAFDMKGDDLKEFDLGSFDSSTPVDADRDLDAPEKLNDTSYTAMAKRLTADLVDDGKQRLLQAIAILKPNARTMAQDKAQAAFWAGLMQRLIKVDEYESQLAARLVSIACVQQGSPFVARALIANGRFLDAGESGNASLKKLRLAAVSKQTNCPGVHGLEDTDFRSKSH